MATPIDDNNAMDFDQPLNDDPVYSIKHVFSTDDVTGTFGGLTQGDVDGETPVIDFNAVPKETKDGVDLFPINSEFGYNVFDFIGAFEKDYEDDPEYEEGWAGDLVVDGQQVGLVLSDAPTDTFKTPAGLGTWLSGLGGNTVKASSEHYVVMQNVLSDQAFPGDQTAEYPLDDDLIMIGGIYDGHSVADLIAGNIDGITIEDVNGDGLRDLRDILEPNETTIDENIAAGRDYSVTMKDDGKLLYRWGNTIKKPNDIRIEAELPLPDEWEEADQFDSVRKLYRVTQAELLIHHTITNNPNDQVRPEDFENEEAIGTLPSYTELPDGTWVTTDGYFSGDGTFYAAGTVLKDPALANPDALSEDLIEGYTNAWYTTMNREPFEAALDENGEYISGPRWRLQPDKYGQDLPSVPIPLDPSTTFNPTKDQVKYEVGMETQTVLNLLDWEFNTSPLSISAGWQNASGEPSINGLNMTNNFDVAFYIKGDVKPATIFSTELVMDYEEIFIYEVDAFIEGTVDSDYLVGLGGNTFFGDLGEDLFVVSYGTTVTEIIDASIITDFEVGIDTIGFIGFGIDILNFDDLVGQTVDAGNLLVDIEGELVATLNGVSEELELDSFLFTNPGPSDGTVTPGPSIITGTEGADSLTGTLGDDEISGLGGNDYIYGIAGDDVIDGGAGIDRLFGGLGEDTFVFAAGTGLDFVFDFEDEVDAIRLEGIMSGDFDSLVSVSEYRTTGTMIQIGSDRMILRNTDASDITADDFIFDDALAII